MSTNNNNFSFNILSNPEDEYSVVFKCIVSYDEDNYIFDMILEKYMEGAEYCKNEEMLTEIQKKLNERYRLTCEYNVVQKNFEIITKCFIPNIQKLTLVNAQRIERESFIGSDIKELNIINEGSNKTIIEKDAFYACRQLKFIQMNSVILEKDSFKSVFPEKATIETDTFSMQSFYTTLQKPEDNLCIKYEATVYKMLSLMMPFQTIECVIKIPLEEQEFIFEYNKRYQTFKNINNVEVEELYNMFTAFNPLFTIHRRFSKILGVVHDMNIKEAFDGNNQKYQRVESELSKKYDINYFNKITKFKKNSTFISTRIWSRMNKEDDQERFEGNMVTIDIEKTNYITIRIQRVFRRIFD